MPGMDAAAPSREEVLLASRELGEGLRQVDLSVPSIHCGGCIQRIERSLNGLTGIRNARVNLSTKRVAIRWRTDDGVPAFAEALAALGYTWHLCEPTEEDGGDRTLSELIRAMAVAGFATGNIMLLSVSVWSGADPATRELFHWISALIALPTLAYSGRVFFRSALQALIHRRTNMDVPISVGVLLAFGLSLYDTFHNGPHAYFDAAVMLLFFLLVGRTLDHVMRERARTAVKGLARLVPRSARVEGEDGSSRHLPVAEIEPGMTLLLAAGERVPVDGVVVSGRSELDCALISGESLPQPAAPGTTVQAGTLNLSGPLTVRASAAASDSFLAEMIRLMEAAESGRSGYRRLSDRAARLYSPLVHAVAIATFAGWMLVAGDLHQAVTIAVAVLIITCPCALGLAVPMVQMVAARRLFDAGVMVKDGAGLERLEQIDSVVFDKTGTLTLGRPVLHRTGTAAPAHLDMAAAIARHSRHPHARALAAMDGGAGLSIPADRVSELPGCGLEAELDGGRYRLGRADWALEGGPDAPSGGDPDRPESVLARDGHLLARFSFDDPLRPGTAAAVANLRKAGLSIQVLSGDRAEPVARLAGQLGIATFEAAVRPQDKLARLERLAAEGHKVLMVGDGLNDAPALAAAHVSMAPASAADVGRNAADFVFLRDDLGAVPAALTLARDAGRLVRQNIGLAILYNAIALPIAVLGHVTPLVAAVAMSGSSIIVVANALRLNRAKGHRASPPASAAGILPAAEAAE